MDAARHDVCAAWSDLSPIRGRFHALLARNDVEGFGARMRVDPGSHPGWEDRFGEVSHRRTGRYSQRADNGFLDAADRRLDRRSQNVEPVSRMRRGDGGPAVFGGFRVGGPQASGTREYASKSSAVRQRDRVRSSDSSQAYRGQLALARCTDPAPEARPLASRRRPVEAFARTSSLLSLAPIVTLIARSA